MKAGSVWVYALLLLLICFSMAVGTTVVQAQLVPNQEAVDQVTTGEISEANVTWWGFDPDDSTEFIQSAIDSGAETVIIPNMGEDWVVRPIVLRSNLRLVLEDGVVVTAKKDEFHGRNDSLFTARDVENLSIVGYGATIRMQKEDYADPLKYEKAEWRMGISIRGSTNVTIEGLTIRDTGGDGIYLGRGSKTYNENVVIRNIVADNNYRQGISVISAKDLLIEDSVFKNTGGTAPMAGIDLEPNQPDERLQNIVVRNNIFEDNEGPGITTYLRYLNSDSQDVSVLWENNVVRGSPVGFSFGYGPSEDFPSGEVIVRNCIIEGSDRNGIRINNKHDAGALTITFEDCTLYNVATNPNVDLEALGGSVPIYLAGDHELSGIHFNNVTVIDDIHRPVLYGVIRTPEDELDEHHGFSNISGQLNVLNPHGAELLWEGPTTNVNLSAVVVESAVVPYDDVFSHPDYDLSSVDVQAEPTIHFVFPSSVRPYDLVQRTFHPHINLLYFDEEELPHVDVLVNDQPVYSGEPPQAGDIEIDTTELHDGNHVLKVVAVGEQTGTIESNAIFGTRNFDYVIDQMEGPREVAWFGEVYNPKTAEQSDGWTYETDGPEDFFGDRTRKTRQSQTSEYLIWETPSLREFEFVVYVQDGSLDDILYVYRAGEQNKWYRVIYEVTDVETSPSGWKKVTVQGRADHGEGAENTQYIRLVLRQSNIERDVQLGRATFQLLLREVE